MLGILIDARNKKLISGINILLERLENEANFWISAELRRQVLQMAGE
ncbi:MAG: DUF3368 domain-containing protein [Limisphaerales bacterium]